MYLLVLGYFPLGLRIFTEFFFSEIGFNTTFYNISIWRKRYLFLSLRLGSSATYFAVNSRACNGCRVIEIGFLKCKGH